MNAVMDVNQSAALVLMSVGKARQLGVPENLWIYMHALSQIDEIWNVSERPQWHSSPALKLMCNDALQQAGLDSADEIGHFDLYSCFPSAVQYACEALGIDLTWALHDSKTNECPRRLTVTGGLPYHGGPGSNYSMHAVAKLMEVLRTAKANATTTTNKRDAYGFVNANGWFATEHACGIFSYLPTPSRTVQQWRDTAHDDPHHSAIQRTVDALPRVTVVDQVTTPTPARIETYTVAFDNTLQPYVGIIIGRLLSPSNNNEQRFIAHVRPNDAVYTQLTARDCVGLCGTVCYDATHEVNYFDLPTDTSALAACPLTKVLPPPATIHTTNQAVARL
eukprot:TRINITY_DN15604_c0_g1_i1.p1 TRINITY_DN15604_c0_g1~~TRINITY_DN15604_c0_g1_i1.p1  ORF type:complete len:388 (+),score=53.62 TRINITY_DN15604_c0_g1_i1:161-1165(+)